MNYCYTLNPADFYGDKQVNSQQALLVKSQWLKVKMRYKYSLVTYAGGSRGMIVG